jgi:hypothetical protein
VNGGHEIDLQAVVVADDAKEVRRGIVGPQHRSVERCREALQPGQVWRRPAEQEVEIDGCHGRARQRRSGVPDQHGLETDLVQQAPDLGEQRFRIHDPPSISPE